MRINKKAIARTTPSYLGWILSASSFLAFVPSDSYSQDQNTSQNISSINERIKALADEEKNLLSAPKEALPLTSTPYSSKEPSIAPTAISAAPSKGKSAKNFEGESESSEPPHSSSVDSFPPSPAIQTAKASRQQAEIKRLQAELSDTKLRLAIAETQVERLSSLLQNSKKEGREVPDIPKGDGDAIESSLPAELLPSIPKLESKEAVPIATVTALQVNLRSAPNRGAGIISTVPQGTKLIVEKQNGSWYRIISPTGLRAWVQGSVISLSRPLNQLTPY